MLDAIRLGLVVAAMSLLIVSVAHKEIKKKNRTIKRYEVQNQLLEERVSSYAKAEVVYTEPSPIICN